MKETLTFSIPFQCSYLPVIEHSSSPLNQQHRQGYGERAEIGINRATFPLQLVVCCWRNNSTSEKCSRNRGIIKHLTARQSDDG